jgi:hypothetical protein
VLTQKTFLGHTTALALQIHLQPTTIQWLCSTRFSVFTPSLSPQSTSKGLASITCTIPTSRHRTPEHGSEFNRQRDKSSHSGGPKPLFLTPDTDILETKLTYHIEIEIARVTDNKNLQILWISPSNTACGKEDQKIDRELRKEC